MQLCLIESNNPTSELQGTDETSRTWRKNWSTLMNQNNDDFDFYYIYNIDL